MLDATLLSNLADLQRQRSDYVSAEALFRRSLAHRRGACRARIRYFASTAWQNLGHFIARERKDTRLRWRTTRAHWPSVSDRRRRRRGFASLLSNLANVYRASGNDALALETHFRALHLWEKSRAIRAGTLVSVGNIGGRTRPGDIAKTANGVSGAPTHSRKTQMSRISPPDPKRQKTRAGAKRRGATDRTISLHLDQAPRDPDAAELAALVLLRARGAVLDDGGRLRRRTTACADPEDRT